MRIALIGVGLIGYPIGKRLCGTEHYVVAYNRTRARSDLLVSSGAQVVDTAREAVQGADLVLITLEDGEAAHAVLFEQGTAAAMARGTLVVDMSSLTPAETQNHAAALQAIGLCHLDAPATGGAIGAETGTLAIMVGGQTEDFERAEPILQILGHSIHVGSHGAGQLAKLASQMIVGISIGAVAEALLFAQRGGADISRVREAIRGGLAESRALDIHGHRMIERDFVRRAAVDMQLKDMRNALFTAERMGCAMPITERVAELYERAATLGWGDLDRSAVFLALETANSDVNGSVLQA